MRNRWLIAAAAVAIHLSIGSVYAYSVLKKPLFDVLGWENIDVTFSFSLAITCLGLSAAFLGPFVEKYGPRIAGSTAGILYATGMVIAGLACQLESISLFYVGYGLLGGMGLGVGYIAPVSTLVRYFPRNRGLATGMAIMGFGFGALLYGPLMAWLLEHYHPMVLFYVLGPWFGLVMVGVSQYLKKPPLDEAAANGADKRAASGQLGQLTVLEAIKRPQFFGLWLMIYVNVTCGIAVISAASPMLQENVGMNAMTAAGVVGLLGLFNGLGRIGWATISDWLGRTTTYALIFVIQIAAFSALPLITSSLPFQIVLFLILTCYGAGFAMLPAYIGDLFGVRQLGAIHGALLTAWSAAGITGPLLYAWLKESTGSMNTAMYAFVGLFVVALIVTVAMYLSLRKPAVAAQVEPA